MQAPGAHPSSQEGTSQALMALISFNYLTFYVLFPCNDNCHNGGVIVATFFIILDYNASNLLGNLVICYLRSTDIVNKIHSVPTVTHPNIYSEKSVWFFLSFTTYSFRISYKDSYCYC